MTQRVIFTPSPAASNDPPNAAGNGHSLEFTTVQSQCLAGSCPIAVITVLEALLWLSMHIEAVADKRLR